jgi:ubiquinone/menaquinone biosynthesis C-methylase UbiE
MHMEHASVKAYKGMGMEGCVARWYAANTGKSMEEFRTLARRVAHDLAPASAVLELAPGPGYFAIELAKLSSFVITGLDISHTFMEIARRNAQEARVAVDFRQGDAAHTPFADESFDFLLCRAAFKNFSDPVGAVREMYRVLKPGGRGVIIDLRRDATQKSINALVDRMGMSWLSRVFTKFTFRFMLLKRAYNRSEFENFVSQTGFHTADIEESPTGFEVWLKK